MFISINCMPMSYVVSYQLSSETEILKSNFDLSIPSCFDVNPSASLLLTTVVLVFFSPSIVPQYFWH